jgi:hypothetical protein
MGTALVFGRFVLANWKWFGIGFLVLALTITGLRLNNAKSDLTKARAQIVTLNASVKAAGAALKASEALRGAEHGDAIKAVQGAQEACSAQVAEARRSQKVIRQIVDRPVPTDPVTHCPAPKAITAADLRSALEP